MAITLRIRSGQAETVAKLNLWQAQLIYSQAHHNSQDDRNLQHLQQTQFPIPKNLIKYRLRHGFTSDVRLCIQIYILKFTAAS